MQKIQYLSTVLLCGSILAGVDAPSALAQEGDYRYGQLLVQRSHSTWNRDPAPQMMPPPMPVENAAPRVIPSYAYPQPAPQPVAAIPTPPPPPPTPVPASPMMSGYYMPAPPPNTTEPMLAPGETLPPPPSMPPVAAEEPVRKVPVLQSEPEEPVMAAAGIGSYPAPSAPAPAHTMLPAEPPRYVSGAQTAPHPMFEKKDERGNLVYVGRSGLDGGYEPAWIRAYFGNGYRRDNLKWNIDSSLRGVTVPNVLSELKWSGLSIYEVKGGAEYTHRKGPFSGFHLELDASYGTIFSGDNQDSDYLASDRQSEFSRSNNDAGDGSVNGFSFALGWEFSPDILGEEAHFGLTPLVGYQREEQKLTMQDGNQTLNSELVPVPLGPFGGLDARYESVWNGPFFGANVGLEWPDHRFALKGKYVDANYKGKGYWNLRPEFRQDPSFLHTANGNGLVFSANYNWRFYYGLELFLEAAYQKWSAEDGIDATFFTDGRELVTGLNEVDWNSQSYLFGLAYKW